MDKIRLNSVVEFGPMLPPFTEDQVKSEPMLFSATPEFAAEHGGPITRAFLERLTTEYRRGKVDKPVYLDTRVHMLMPGWYPAIPGWHHDDVPRSRADGQPDYETPAYEARHTLALVNADVAPTEFALGSAVYPIIKPGAGNVYKHWHEHTEKLLGQGVLVRYSVPDRTLVNFDCYSMHQAVPAVRRGWRWFGRASYCSDKTPRNEIRRQVQVYLKDPTLGW
jgi:hypothetical protein